MGGRGIGDGSEGTVESNSGEGDVILTALPCSECLLPSPGEGGKYPANGEGPGDFWIALSVHMGDEGLNAGNAGVGESLRGSGVPVFGVSFIDCTLLRFQKEARFVNTLLGSTCGSSMPF